MPRVPAGLRADSRLDDPNADEDWARIAGDVRVARRHNPMDAHECPPKSYTDRRTDRFPNRACVAPTYQRLMGLLFERVRDAWRHRSRPPASMSATTVTRPSQ